MPFTVTWSETSPQGTAAANTLDTIIQQLKTSVRERLQFGGVYFPSDHDELSGEHSYVRCAEQSSNPTGVANKGFLFVKDASGVAELYYMDDASQAIQLTSNGALKDSVSAKSGDFLSSGVTTARSGWTNVTSTYTGKFMRIGGTPLTTGGADTHTHGAGSYAGPSHSHTVPASSAVWGTGAKTDGKLTTAQDGGNSANTDASTSSSGTGAVTGTSASGDNVPAYVSTVLWKKD